MARNEARESNKRLPEHAPRLDWMKLAPDVYKAMIRLDTVASHGVELTEAITMLTDGFVLDEVYTKAANEFDETELSHLIAAITTINAFNRFGVSTRMVPGHYMPDLSDVS